MASYDLILRGGTVVGTGDLARESAPADLTLVGLDAAFVLGQEDLFYRHKASPFGGRRFRGRVVRTIVGGRTVFRDGEIVSRPLGRLRKLQKPVGDDP